MSHVFDTRDPLILDGGLATELERRGADLADPLWSAKLLVENPTLIRDVHEDYFRAGADVGISASYQASFLRFMRRGVEPRQAADLMRLSVRLVQEARERVGRDRLLVAASIGCYGASLADGSEYRGDYDLTVDELVDWHRPRLETLVEAGPDLLACETIPCLAEVEALARLLAEFQMPAWISCTCGDGTTLRSGESFADAMRIASGPANVVAVGVNCTAPEHVETLLRVAAGVSDKPLLAYPNSGEVWRNGAWTAAPQPMAWTAWHAAGARLLGGCCRTTPDTIRTLRAAFPA